MPNPFNKDNEQPVEHSTGARVDEVDITHSELICDECFGTTTEGKYVPKAKRLSWTCVECGSEQVVRGIEL